LKLFKLNYNYIKNNLKGGVIQILIEWNCNLDLGKECLPKYSFRRFDIPFKQTATSSGFNFRFADKFNIENKEQRILYKAYGLRFIIR
jgi:P2X purinoceptor 4